ncbi:MAG TPA: hypothetical protein VEP93_03760 [Variovorax sp.]|nr:hypothetical protein [Variovorax sp.]
MEHAIDFASALMGNKAAVAVANTVVVAVPATATHAHPQARHAMSAAGRLWAAEQRKPWREKGRALFERNEVERVRAAPAWAEQRRGVAKRPAQ